MAMLGLGLSIVTTELKVEAERVSGLQNLGKATRPPIIVTLKPSSKSPGQTTNKTLDKPLSKTSELKADRDRLGAP